MGIRSEVMTRVLDDLERKYEMWLKRELTHPVSVISAATVSSLPKVIAIELFRQSDNTGCMMDDKDGVAIKSQKIHGTDTREAVKPINYRFKLSVVLAELEKYIDTERAKL
ncbi:hypothetical protein VPHD479_0074 [Vibrio phage D479]